MNYKEITIKLGKKPNCSTCESNMHGICANSYYGTPLYKLSNKEKDNCGGWDIDFYTFSLGIDRGLID